MELSEIGKKYIFTTRIDLDEADFIELREPTAKELRDFSDNEKKNAETLGRLFPACLVDHSFTIEGQKADSKAVAAELEKSGSRYVQIIETWMESIPFKKKNSKRSET